MVRLTIVLLKKKHKKYLRYQSIKINDIHIKFIRIENIKSYFSFSSKVTCISCWNDEDQCQYGQHLLVMKTNVEELQLFKTYLSNLYTTIHFILAILFLFVLEINDKNQVSNILYGICCFLTSHSVFLWCFVCQFMTNQYKPYKQYHKITPIPAFIFKRYISGLTVLLR